MAGTGGIQVLRFATRRTLDLHLVRHVEGLRRHATTRTTATIDGGPACVDLGGVGFAAARAAVERHWPSGRGRKPHQALDMVFAGPPPYVIPARDSDGKVVKAEDEDGVLRPVYMPNPERWSPKRERKWAKSIARKLSELVGSESVIVSVTLHRDELAAHVQAVVVPIHNGRLGWCRVRDAAAARVSPQVKDARKKAIARGEEAPELSTRTRYGVLQDALYWGVSREFGLARGQVGSEATHVEIDRAAAAEAREGHALYEAEQARAAAKEAAAAADASRQARDDYHDQAVENLTAVREARRDKAAAERERNAARTQQNQARAAAREAAAAAEDSRRARDDYHDQAVENLTAVREARRDKAAAERERDTACTERDQAVGDLAAFNARGPWVRRVREERKLQEREQREAERRAELDHKQSELEEREEQVAELERRQDELAAGEARLEEDRTAVAAERRTVDETLEEARAVSRITARRREKLESLALDVRDGRQELARREAKLAAEQEAFEPARHQLAADQRTVEEREETIRRDEAALTAREEAVQGLEDRETAVRNAQGALQVERERLTAERAAAEKMGAQALRDRREVAAQREEVQRRDQELVDWDWQLGVQSERQEKREEHQARTADELAARQRELNVESDRMRRHHERRRARLLRWRKKARRFRSWARQLADRERTIQGLEDRERQARAILGREADLVGRESAVQELEARDRNLEARERRVADDAAKAASDREAARAEFTDARQMRDHTLRIHRDTQNTRWWGDAKRIIATAEKWVSERWASAGPERREQAVQSLRSAWTEALRAPPPRAIAERDRGREIGR